MAAKILGGLAAGARIRLARHRPLLEAAMAASALVALADGHVTFSESHRLDEIIETIEQLRVFDAHEGVELFKDYIDAVALNPEAGRKQALSAIDRIADDKDEARLLVRLCLAVSAADGVFQDEERERIVEICARLGLAPDEFGL
ncbi:MAG: TerB family tellurite resistance protein [Rhodospirillales bacterium]|nr:TerB family tellurite resistance protein [Rhodospirillales bacterium]